MSIVYINGEYKPLTEATVNVLDRGFTFGDGVYEVIPVFNKTIFRYDEHMQRLNNSLESIYMQNPLTKNEWSEIFEKLIGSEEQLNQSIYLQITRGVSERDHSITLADEPTVFAMSRPIMKKDFSTGINAITHDDIRWQYCDIKAVTLLPSVILRHIAQTQDAREAILIRDGLVTEGAASNVFICKAGKVMTPPKSRHVLPGITRDLVLEILIESKIDCSETEIDKELLVIADEIWVTSSTWEIVPVVNLDGKPVADGSVGSIWKETNMLYQNFKNSFCQ